LRIAVCTKYDLFGAIALNRLLPHLQRHRIEVFYSVKTRPAENVVPELALLKAIERSLPLEVAFPLIERLPESPGLSTFNQLAERYGFVGRPIANLKKDDGGRLIADFAPDLILSIRFSLIFRKHLIDLPRHGIINVHPGRLPAYGGLYAPFRQMMAEEPRLGCTVHFIDEGIDTGPILAVEEVPFERERSMVWHAARLYPAGVRRLAQLVHDLETGRPLLAEPQTPAERGYFTFPTADEFAAFRAKGLKLIDGEDITELMRLFAAPAAASTTAARA
jgi:methionyl-tRNA formyltransferase